LQAPAIQACLQPRPKTGARRHFHLSLSGGLNQQSCGRTQGVKKNDSIEQASDSAALSACR
jgi:hypothetical protein